MLKKTSPGQYSESISLPIAQASFPAPFKSTLEFSAPAHGVWNIVHTGMLIPESHQIFICPANCMRGVVLTAAEMNAPGRFSQVLIEEKDVLAGSIEKLTIDGVCECLEKLPVLPRAVLIFTVCMHHFMGADLDWIYKELKRRYPEIDFIRCFMDPVMRKSGLTPDQKMRKSLYEAVRPLPVNSKTVSVLGSDFALDETCDLKKILAGNGYKIKELPACRTYEEYLSIGESALFISVYPAAEAGAESLAKRLGRPHIHLPLSFGYDEINKNSTLLINALSSGAKTSEAAVPDEISLKQESCRAALSALRERLNDAEIAIDYTFHPRPLSLAKLLLECGFNVKRIYIDVISGQEEEDFYYLKENFPSLVLKPTVSPACRLAHRKASDVLSLGQKAAWFEGSRHFANIVQGSGWYGYDGILKLCAAMEEAFETEKDPKELIPLKGLGCESCVL